MSVFSAELAQVAARAKQSGDGLYGLPWYLVVGEPNCGKSATLRALNLEWVGEPMAGQYCQYWFSRQAVFIEAREPLVGQSKNPELLRTLCEEIMKIRPREPLDGILLVLSAQDVAERSDEPLEAFAQHSRSYLVEACRVLSVDIPVYIIVNRYDTLWGFAEVFAWNAERAKEDAWGLLVPPDVPSQNTFPKIEEGLDGLGARIEAQCLSKLSSDEGVEQRVRAFQHLVEARMLLDRLREVLKILSFASAYERAPWTRAVILGCAVPGVGDRLRAGVARFANMGLAQNPYDPHRSPRPGGLPLFSFMRGVVLPERELVPLKVRWRDDWITMIGIVLGTLLLIAGLVLRYR